MKKTCIKVAAMAVMLTVGMTFTNCKSKQVTTDYKPTAGSPFGEVYEAPCAEQDTDEYFVGLGIANGSKMRMDVLQTSALTNAQNVVRQKMQHAYKGAIDDYSNYMGNNMGSDAEVKVERAGTQIIDRMINDTRAWCGPKFSGVDDKGDVTCYIGIRINKGEVAQAIAKHLSNDEELKIRFNEQEFRKRMDESFQKFKEGN
jgi:hypothetical protein